MSGISQQHVERSERPGLDLAGKFRRWLARRVTCGEITIHWIDGRTMTLRGGEPGPVADLIIHRPRVFRRLAWGGAVGFAEAFMDGDWDTTDLATLIEFGARNQGETNNGFAGGTLQRALRQWFHRRRTNTVPGSRKNILAHYDLGNDFYSKWLDPSMTYSSAIFQSEHDDLEAAQSAKYAQAAQTADLKADHEVLEIGCGWGGFSVWAAKNTGCRATAITVSDEQYTYAKQRVFDAGLQERVNIRLIDYRHIREKFDRIVSIEMFEAVGEDYWPVYFDKLRASLKTGGKAALQIITIADRMFDTYRKDVDFIQRYIFPGGMLPSPSVLDNLSKNAGLICERSLSFGGDYARTLAHWRRNFDATWDDISQLGFDETFQRMWIYYLAYCEAGFRSGQIDVCQRGLRLGP